MSSTPIKTVGVIGTGVIGSSWTALFLAKGLKVIVTDPAPGAEAKLRDYLQKHCSEIPNALVSPDACLNNFTFVKEINSYLGDIDLIQENGLERLDFKRRLFAQLDANTPEHVLIASSSSGLPSSEFIIDCKRNPARVLIGHPFNPPHLVPLVEIVPHPGTGEVYVTAAREFYSCLDKDPVVVKQETPGFIANRLQAAVCAEAYSLISRGVVSAEDLDKTMTSGLGIRWALSGPIMTNTLGGGRDFAHIMDHLGPAMQVWLDDMQKHKFKFGSQQVDTVKQRVNEWVSKVDLAEVEEKRDTSLRDVVRSRAEKQQSKISKA